MEDLLRSHRRLVALVLAVAAGRILVDALAPPPPDLLDPATGPPGRLPDLARDGWAVLTGVPGLGPERAHRLVHQRPALGVDLAPGLLHLLPGFGPGLERGIAVWYGQGGRAPPQAAFLGPERGG